MTTQRNATLDELCYIIVQQNKRQNRRQRARSRVNYFTNIQYGIKHPNHRGQFSPQIPKKFSDGPATAIKVAIKRNKAEQLLAEVDVHTYSQQTSKRKRQLLRELGYRQAVGMGTNMIIALIAVSSENQNLRKDDIQAHADSYVHDNILLGDGALPE